MPLNINQIKHVLEQMHYGFSVSDNSGGAAQQIKGPDDIAVNALIQLQCIDENDSNGKVHQHTVLRRCLDVPFRDFVWTEKYEGTGGASMVYQVTREANHEELLLSNRARIGYCLPGAELRANVLQQLIADHGGLTLRSLAARSSLFDVGFQLCGWMAASTWLHEDKARPWSEFTYFKESLPGAIGSLLQILSPAKSAGMQAYLTDIYNKMCNRIAAGLTQDSGPGRLQCFHRHSEFPIITIMPTVVLTVQEANACKDRLFRGCLDAVLRETKYGLTPEERACILLLYKTVGCKNRFEKAHLQQVNRKRVLNVDFQPLIRTCNLSLALPLRTNAVCKAFATVLLMPGVFAMLAGTGHASFVTTASMLHLGLALGIVAMLAGLLLGVLSMHGRIRGGHKELVLLLCALVLLSAGLCTTLACAGGGALASAAVLQATSSVQAGMATAVTGGVLTAAGGGLALFSTKKRRLVKKGENAQEVVNAMIDAGTDAPWRAIAP